MPHWNPQNVQESVTTWTTSPIICLPTVLQLYLSRFLDVASLFIYSERVCRHLRTVFSQFSRIYLFLVPQHRLNLAEWKRAAHALNELKSPFHFPQAPQHYLVPEPSRPILSYSDVIKKDAHFLTRLLEFLGDRYVDRIRSEPSPIPPRLKSLTLVGWYGFDAFALIWLLSRHPLLASVATIIKTEFNDSHIWSDSFNTNNSSSYPSWLQQGLPYDSCINTQAIVQVGKRKKSQPGEARLKGEGLQIGYESLCLEMSTHDPHKTLRPCKLHVVFIHRYDELSDENVEMDQLFQRSTTTCNSCKQELVI